MQNAPSQISPSESFDLFYFIRNHTDAATYYVRAVVYDVRTGEVLLTTNLDPSATNARLFAKTVQAPADPVGIGRNIVAIATAYTDSDYTTKSTDYEEQEQYYLIRAAAPVIGGGGIDYRALRDMVDESIRTALAALPKPSAPERIRLPNMPFDSIFGAIGVLQREISRIPKDIPDLNPIFAALETLRTDISEQITALPQPVPTNLSPLVNRMNDLDTAFGSLKSLMGKLMTALPPNLVEKSNPPFLTLHPPKCAC